MQGIDRVRQPAAAAPTDLAATMDSLVAALLLCLLLCIPSPLMGRPTCCSPFRPSNCSLLSAAVPPAALGGASI